MTPSKRKTPQRELLSRYGVLSTWRADIHILSKRPRGEIATREGRVYLEVKGDLTEPVAGITRFSVLTFVSDKPTVGQGEVPSVGSITKVKPELQVSVDLSLSEFQTLMQLATTEKLRSCYLAFLAPRRGRAPIVSISFGTGMPDDDG